MDFKRKRSKRRTTWILMMMPVLGALAQTSPIDVLAEKKFGFSVISKGDNIPDFPIREDNKDLLLMALHKNIDISEFKTKTGFSHSKIDMLLRFLEEKNYIQHMGGLLKPAIFIADADDGRRLFTDALPVSREIVKAIKESLPSIKGQFNRTDMSKSRGFEDWAFFILSDVLLDNWQIDNVEREFLKTTTRPPRHGKNYYISMLERNEKNEPFGLYGNQVGDISIYGNNRIGRKAATTENKVSASDLLLLDKMAADFFPRLLEILEKTRKYAEKIHVDSGYAKEIAFGEFYIWWYHFIYTKATDLMAEDRMLTLPADGNFFYQVIEN